MYLNLKTLHDGSGSQKLKLLRVILTPELFMNYGHVTTGLWDFLAFSSTDVFNFANLTCLCPAFFLDHWMTWDFFIYSIWFLLL